MMSMGDAVVVGSTTLRSPAFARATTSRPPWQLAFVPALLLELLVRRRFRTTDS